MEQSKQLKHYYKTKGKLSYRSLVARNLRNLRCQSKKRGIPFEVTIDDMILNETCPVLGIPILPYGPLGNRPSIDKIDKDLGYVLGNVRIISHRANRWKNDMTLQQAKLLIENWNKISA